MKVAERRGRTTTYSAILSCAILLSMSATKSLNHQDLTKPTRSMGRTSEQSLL